MSDEKRKPEENEKTYPIVCTLCGSKDRLPYRPRKGEDSYCQACFKFKRGEVNKKRQKTSPRKRHGTRVTFPIECAQCGNEEILDYVPKGVSLHEVLCSECVRTTHGDESRWAKIKAQKESEQQGEWEITCAECGREDYLKFEPKPEKDYTCVRCFQEQARPSPERLQGKKRVGRAVYIRKSDDEEKAKAKLQAEDKQAEDKDEDNNS